MVTGNNQFTPYQESNGLADVHEELDPFEQGNVTMQ